MRPSEYKSSYACTESNQIQNHIQPMLMENLYSGGVMDKKKLKKIIIVFERIGNV